MAPRVPRHVRSSAYAGGAADSDMAKAAVAADAIESCRIMTVSLIRVPVLSPLGMTST
jgi:hypothetical protein